MNEVYEVVAKSLQNFGIKIVEQGKDYEPDWFTVVGPAQEFIDKIGVGELVNVTIVGRTVTFVRKVGFAQPKLVSAVPPVSSSVKKEFVPDDEYEHPAFLGMCMNQAFEYTMHRIIADVTVEGFLTAYGNNFKKFVEANRKLRQEIEKS